MAVTFERTIAGEVAYLEGRRNGPVLMWSPDWAGVRFGINRPGGSLIRVANPERFGPTPRTSAQFREFARRFAAAGSDRRRAAPTAHSRAARRRTAPSGTAGHAASTHRHTHGRR